VAEAKHIVQPVEVEYVCDSCNTGVMRSTGVGLMSSPPQYPHKCNHCGSQSTFKLIYPYITYERVNRG
jgi:hypothetical protein